MDCFCIWICLPIFSTCCPLNFLSLEFCDSVTPWCYTLCPLLIFVPNVSFPPLPMSPMSPVSPLTWSLSLTIVRDQMAVVRPWSVHVSSDRQPMHQCPVSSCQFCYYLKVCHQCLEVLRHFATVLSIPEYSGLMRDHERDLLLSWDSPERVFALSAMSWACRGLS